MTGYFDLHDTFVLQERSDAVDQLITDKTNPDSQGGSLEPMQFVVSKCYDANGNEKGPRLFKMMVDQRLRLTIMGPAKPAKGSGLLRSFGGMLNKTQNKLETRYPGCYYLKHVAGFNGKWDCHHLNGILNDKGQSSLFGGAIFYRPRGGNQDAWRVRTYTHKCTGVNDFPFLGWRASVDAKTKITTVFFLNILGNDVTSITIQPKKIL